MENVNPEGFEEFAAQVTVYISSEVATSGTISIPRRGLSRTFTVAANSTTAFNLTALGWFPTVLGSGVKRDQGIAVETADSVTVFAFNYAQNVSDAAVILPIQNLGNEYYAMTVFGASFPNPLASDINRLAEVAIIASQPNTQVEITPTATTQSGNLAGVPFTVTLEQGQVFQIQSQDDLTGTYIRAVGDDGCRPFAVYSGNKWQSICQDNPLEQDFGEGCTGGNHLMEPMLPVKTWGLSFLTVPYAGRTTDYIRILASEDGTEVLLNGTTTATLGRGGFYAFTTGSPTEITVTKPVMVCQFSQSQDNDNNGFGDPFMINLSPVEQRLTKITFNAFEAVQPVNFYVNIVTDADRTGELTLDGVAPTSPWITVPGTNLAYVQQLISSGNHTVFSSAGFVAYVYAFGQNVPGGNNFEAYGYSAGFRAENLTLQIAFSEPEVCTGKPVSLSGITTIPTNEFLWSIFSESGSLVQTLSGQNVVTSFDLPGRYSVLLNIERTGICSRDSVVGELVVGTVPQILTPDTAICRGFGFPLRTIPPEPGATYLWSPSGGLSSATSPTPTVSTTTSQTYTLRVTTPEGCIYRDTVRIDVGDPVEITTNFRDTAVCVGASLSFVGSEPADWFRLRDGIRTSLALATNNLQNVLFSVLGTDTIQFTDGVCTDEVRIHVIESPSIQEAPEPSLCTGDTRVFTSDSPGDWFLRRAAVETPLAVGSRSSGPVVFTAPGTDEIIVRGCSSQDLRTISVVQSPVIEPNVPDTTYCVDEVASFQSSVSGSWRLLFEGSEIQDYGLLAAGTPISVQPDLLNGRGRYDLVLENEGCPDTLTIYGAVRVFSITTPDSDIAICSGDAVSFIGTEYGYWYLEQGASRSQIARVTDRVEGWVFPVPGTFTVALENCGGRASRQVTVFPYPQIQAPLPDTLEVCAGASVAFRSDLVGQWVQQRIGNTAEVVSPAASEVSVPFAVSGTYWVTVTTDGCTDTTTVLAQPLPNAQINASLTRNVSCFGAGDASAVLLVSGGSPPYRYLWNTGATTESLIGIGPGLYTVVVTDDNGCQDSQAFTVAEPSLLIIDSVQVDSATCFETRDGEIRAFVRGGTPPYFVNGLSGTELSNLGIGTYSIRITDANNCEATLPSAVSVDSPEALLLSPLSTDNNCGRGNSQATVQVIGGVPPYRFSWNDPAASTDSLLTGLPAGTYTVTVQDHNNCLKTASVTILDIPGPTADFTSEPQAPTTLIAGASTVQFINRSKRGVVYRWDFGDGHTSSQENPRHTYALAGIYRVSLEVRDAADCDETFEVGPLEVIDQPVLEIPNVFTPNGDTVNDELVFQVPGVRSWEIQIRDRTGKRIFSSNSISQSWDGTFNGAEVPAGAYYYDLKLVYVNGVEIRKAGTISLLR